MTQNNLGSAYASCRQGTGRPTCSRPSPVTSRPCTLHARGRPPRLRHDPEQPGRRLRELPTGDRAANLKQAIACYEQALRVFTPEAAPFDYATAQNNLGAAYRQLPMGTGRPT